MPATTAWGSATLSTYNATYVVWAGYILQFQTDNYSNYEMTFTNFM